jgi:hypothetical protein
MGPLFGRQNFHLSFFLALGCSCFEDESTLPRTPQLTQTVGRCDYE